MSMSMSMSMSIPATETKGKIDDEILIVASDSSKKRKLNDKSDDKSDDEVEIKSKSTSKSKDKVKAKDGSNKIKKLSSKDRARLRDLEDDKRAEREDRLAILKELESVKKSMLKCFPDKKSIAQQIELLTMIQQYSDAYSEYKEIDAPEDIYGICEVLDEFSKQQYGGGSDTVNLDEDDEEESETGEKSSEEDYEGDESYTEADEDEESDD